ncbi:MAG: UPF0158 family protein [Clostridiales bacterium]|nr:UPF0158 family protein [Clostridiales bacterium]
MRKLDLNTAVLEFEKISQEMSAFYNKETGEFDFFDDFVGYEEADTYKFEDEAWIALPKQHEINEYSIMADFAEAITDPRKSEILCMALNNRGAFRRFKDSLHGLDLTQEWYAFKHDAYLEIVKDWCDRKGIEYSDNQSG